MNKKTFLACKTKAEKRVADAQFQTGLYYKQGKGVEKSLKQFFSYYRLAAKHRYPKAWAKLDYYFVHGIRVEQSDEKAFKALSSLSLSN